MNIVCLGGGPAGLYFGISMKLRDPQHTITIYERNRPGDTFGWGVVFSDQTVDNLIGSLNKAQEETIEEVEGLLRKELVRAEEEYQTELEGIDKNLMDQVDNLMSNHSDELGENIKI